MVPPQFIQIGNRIINVNTIAVISWSCYLWTQPKQKPPYTGLGQMARVTPLELTLELLMTGYDAPKRATMELTIEIADGQGVIDIYEDNSGGRGSMGQSLKLQDSEAFQAWQKLTEVLQPMKIL